MEIIDRLTYWQYLIPQTEGKLLVLVSGDISDDFVSRIIPSENSIIKICIGDINRSSNLPIIDLPDNSVGGGVIIGVQGKDFNDNLFSELLRVMAPGVGICFFVSKMKEVFRLKQIPRFYGFEPVKIYGVLPNISYPRWIVPLRAKYFISSTRGIFKPTKPVKRILWKFITQLSYIGFQYFMVDGYLAVLKKKREVESADISKGFFAVLRCLFKREDLEIAILNRSLKYYKNEKITVQVMNSDNKLLAYIKIAESTQSRLLLSNEYKIIKALKHLNLKTGKVPQIIHFTEDNHRTILIQKAESMLKPGPIYLTEEHVSFLAEIFCKTVVIYEFEKSPLFEDMKNGIVILKEEISEGWFKLLEDALRMIFQKFKNKEIHLGLIHGDFTAWNTSEERDGKLFVFDWEESTLKGVPFYDFYNFVINTEVLIKHRNPQEIIARLFNGKSFYERLLCKYKMAIDYENIIDCRVFFLVYLYQISIYYLNYQNTRKQHGINRKSDFNPLAIIQPILEEVLEQLR